MKAEFLYITFNRLEYTKYTLPQVLDKAGYLNYSVYIFDNGSTDGTVEYLQALKHKNIKHIHYNKENVGISPAANQFWAQAQSDLVGKIDNDVWVPDNWLTPIIERFKSKDPKLGVVGLSHFHVDDLALIPEADLKHNIRTLSNNTKVVIQTHMGGACYLFPIALYHKFGPMPPRNKDILKRRGPGTYFKQGWTGRQNEFFINGYYIAYVYPWFTCRHLDDHRNPECLHHKMQLPQEKLDKISKSAASNVRRLITSPRPGKK